MARTRQSDREFAATYDMMTGAPVGNVVSGGAVDVDISDHIRAMAPGRRYVALHTHRTSTSFSDADALLLVANRAIRTIAVVGADGTWYLLSKVRGAGVAGANRLVQAFTSAAIALSRRYLALAQSGAVTPEEALRQFSHEIWQHIAPPLHLRYDRVR
ncbi:MAG: hypothetical protein ACRDI2_11810 [Chloroflexota bacterium]